MRRKWKTISVPERVWEDVKVLAEELNLPRWKVIEKALANTPLDVLKGERRNETDWGRIVWYIFKLVNSIAMLKCTLYHEGDLEQESVKTLRTLKQIKERLGVDTREIEEAVKRLIENPTGKNVARLNDATKELISILIMENLIKG